MGFIRNNHRGIKLLKDLGEFDRDVIIGNTVINEKQNFEIKNVQFVAEFTSEIEDGAVSIYDNVSDFQTLGRNLTKKTSKEMVIVADLVQITIHNTFLASMDSYFVSRVEVDAW